MTKAAQVERAQDYFEMAEELAAQAVKDETLVAHKEQLVTYYRQIGELTQIHTTYMEPDGSVILTDSATKANYERLSQQLRASHDTAEVERNALQLFCSFQ